MPQTSDYRKFDKRTRTDSEKALENSALFHGGRCLIAVTLLVLLSACSSTRIQSTRHAVNPAAVPFRSIIVMGMDERGEVRGPFEDDLAAFLAERGITAKTSHPQFTFAELKGDQEQIRQHSRALGAEAALFVRVTDQADFARGPPASLGSMDMGAVDESRYNALTRPGGDMDTSLRLGARLYRVTDGSVVWSGLLQTVVKEDSDSVVIMRNVARIIVAQMTKDKVIP